MGWCSGTDVFNPVAKAIIDSDASEEAKVDLLVKVIRALWDQDWDCEWDSHLINHPLVRRAFVQLDPPFYDWYDMEGEDGD